MKNRFYKLIGIAIAFAVPLALHAAYNGPSGTPPNNNTQGPLWLQSGAVTYQPGDYAFNGDAYFSSSKALRVDGTGSTILNVSNYKSSGATGFTMNVVGDLTITGGTFANTTGTLRVPNICLSGVCRNSWPSGGSGTLGGSGTTDYIPVFTAASTLGSSILRQGSGSLAIGAAPDPGKTFNVQSSGIAIYGTGSTYGVQGVSAATGVYGTGAVGVFGLGTTAGLQGSGPIGVLANATDKGITSSGTNYSFYGATGVLYNSGNVGIGTTAPAATLHVVNLSTTAGAVETILSRAIGDTNFRLETRKGITANVSGGLESKFSLTYNGTPNASINFHRGPGVTGGFLSFSSNDDTEKMRLDANGNLGIGTASPGHKLSVIGSMDEDGLQIDAPTYPEIQFSRGGAVKGYMGVAGTAGGYGAGTLADSVILRSENALHLISNSGRIGATVLNGNVGIGTTSPGSPLEVVGVRSGTHVAVTYARDTLTGYELYGLSQNASLIASGPNSTYAEIAGITGGVYGSSASTYGTGVYGTGNGAGMAGYVGTDYGVGGHFENSFDQYNYNMAEIGGYGYGVAATGTNFAVRASSANYSFYGAAGTLFNAGRVGIGTNSPQISLAVGDTDTGLHSAGDGLLDVYSNSIRTMSIRSGNVGLGTNDPSLSGMSNTFAVSRGAGGIYGLGMNYTGAWYMSLVTEGQKRLTIMDGGRIGVGKTDPGFPLTVYGPNDTSSLGLMQYNDSNAGWSMKASSDGSLYFYRVVSNNSENYRSKMDQNTGAYSQVSDRDLKQDISKLTKYGIADLMKLEPVTYSFKDDASRTTQIGFVAQDVQKVMPEFVSGKAVSKGGDGLSVNYAGFVPVLTAGMQEQQKEIDALKAQNAELLKRLEALEAKVK